MKRLTYREDDGKAFSNFLRTAVVDKLADYEDAEQNGVLKMLPCRVGDTVYLISSDGKIREGICKSIQIDENDNMVFAEGKDFAFWRKFERFGKTVFLTRAEAEQTLAKKGDKTHE